MIPPLLLIFTINILTGLATNVHLLVPKFIPTGASPTLICQYDLEGKSLYAVKWYRGQHEFFRYVPGGEPRMLAFPLGGIRVDVLGSGPDKVKLINVPKYISGQVKCEVSEEKTFRTTVDSKNLTVVDYDVGKPILNVSSNVFYPEKNISITCLVDVTKPLPLINFYVDYVKIKRDYITDFGNGSAILHKEALLDFLKPTPEEYISPIWIRCDAFLQGIYHKGSSSFPIVPVYTSRSTDFQRKGNKSSISRISDIWTWIILLAPVHLRIIL